MSRFWAFTFLCVFFCLFSTSKADASCLLKSKGEQRALGTIVYNADWQTLQTCTTSGWRGLNPMPHCKNIGDTCPGSGIVFIGKYNGKNLYVTPQDAPGTYAWNNGDPDARPDLDNAYVPNCNRGGTPRIVNGQNRYGILGAPGCTDGKAYTIYQANFTGAGAPYRAAQYCYHLGKNTDPQGADNPLAHGYDDWYLPSVDEFEFMKDSLIDMAGYNFSNSYYWTSSETYGTRAWFFRPISGNRDITDKHHGDRSIRCMRQS